MRRFWAHITLVFTALIAMGVSFCLMFTKVNTNFDYKAGQEVTYRISDKYNADEVFENQDAVLEIAGIMKERLDIVGLTSYNVQVVGNDIIKVQFTEPNEVSKNNIISYLGFNGSLALSNKDDDANYLDILGDQFLREDAKAYLDNVNGYPTIVIPIQKDSGEFQKLVESTKKQKEAGVGETVKTGGKDENGNDKTEVKTYIYLWYDFDPDTDRFSRTQEDSSDYDVNIARKIIMTFNIDDLYYPDGNEDKLATSLKVGDGSSAVSVSDVSKAFNNARFYVNLLNSSELNYKVDCININDTNYIPAQTENLIVNGSYYQYLNFSFTALALIIAIVVISLILSVAYKLSTLTIMTTSLGTLFASISFMILLGAEFNIGAVIALTAISIASLACGIIYSARLKSEIYKGRSLKKANSEASKKSLLPTVDICLAVVLIGAFVYMLGGSSLRTFGLVSVLGGLTCFLINAVFFRLLIWLPTNNTQFTKRLSLFGVDEKNIPVASEDEKLEPYKGDFAGKNFSKHSKKIGLVSLLLAVAGLAGLITFASLNNNQPYAQATSATYSQLYVYSNNKNITRESLEQDLLDNVIIYSSSSDTEGKKLATYVKDIRNYEYTETIESVEVTTYYFEYDLSAHLTENTEALATFDGYVGSRESLKAALENYHGFDPQTKSVTVKEGGIYAKNQIDFSRVAIGTLIATAVMGLYFLLRYKLSRGITMFILPLATTSLGAGIFALTRLAFPPVTSIVIPVLALVSIVFCVYIASKEKEAVADARDRKIGYDRRKELMDEAVSTSLEEVLFFAFVTAFIFASYFAFGPSTNKLLYVILTVATIFTTIIVVNQFGLLSNFFYRRFARVENAKFKVKKSKKKGNISKKPNEPEEAIFIGIND